MTAPDGARSRAVTLGPLVASAVFGIVFIARTASSVNGSLVFSLFDDAMISMRYARNLAHGHGLVWNADAQPVEGYTNFLWTLWMAGLHLLPVPDTLMPLLVSVSSLVLVLLCTLVAGRVAREIAPSSRVAAPAAMWFTGLYFPMIYWSLRGMEVALIAFLTISGALLAIRLHKSAGGRTPVLLALCLGALVLTRPDGALPAAIIGSFAMVTAPRHRRVSTAILAAAAIGLPFISQTAFRLAYYGDPLPNTYYLKVVGIALSGRVHRGAYAMGYLVLLEIGVPVLLGTVSFWRRTLKSVHPGVYLLAALLAGQAAYSTYVGGDAWEVAEFGNRYIASMGPVLMTFAALGLGALLQAQDGSRARNLTILVALLAGIALLRGLDLRPVVGLHLRPVDLQSPVERVLPAILAAAGMAGGGLLLARGPRAARGMVVPALLVLCILGGTVGREVIHWGFTNAYLLSLDTKLTRYGLELRGATDERATIAQAAAGSIAYFSDRPAIDLLGKSDAVVAHGPSRTQYPDFIPGHSKWNFDHSIGQLRPDVLASFYYLSDGDRVQISAWGYDEVAPDVYVLRGSPRIDPAAIKRAAERLLSKSN